MHLTAEHARERVTEKQPEGSVSLLTTLDEHGSRPLLFLARRDRPQKAATVG